MDNNIITYSTFWNLVDIDTNDHKLKVIATLFLDAMNDWPTTNQTDIRDFAKELKDYFGSPLTVQTIESKKHNGQNSWQLEAGSSIVELIHTATTYYNQSNFDEIFKSILSYYNEEFSQVDFIANLHYLTTEEGGRKSFAYSGYRPHLKFDFSENQTSGRQIFIDKDIVSPGDNVNAKIKMLCPELFDGCLTEGMSFEFREGRTAIGTGQINYIVNDRLEKASR